MTLSELLQGLVPAVLWLTWWRREGRGDRVRACRAGFVAAVPLTAAAAWLFRRADAQAPIEAALATVALGGMLWFYRALRHSARGTHHESTATPTLAFIAILTALFIVRQLMETVLTVVVAAFEVRSLDATRSIAEATALAIVLVLFFTWWLRRISPERGRTATLTSAAVFIAIAALYAIHEGAEGGLLPWSEPVHAATEPYGPQGIYGRHASALLIVVPLLGAAIAALRPRGAAIVRPLVPASARARIALLAAVLLPIAVLAIVATRRSESPAPHTAADAAAISAVLAAPHVLFRHTGPDAAYGQMAATKLEAPGAGRATLPLSCERIAFAAGRGLCLQADRGVFTTYRAVFLDGALQPRATVKLDGGPSRARVSADGRIGSATVFLSGHGYANIGISTRTTLFDMTSGDVIGDLEQFSTWRDGKRVHEKDVNFWGVTFAGDGSTFFATLQTGGRTFLVRGDIALRKLTVLHDDVECPSLSPDNTLIAFKKRLPGTPVRWRLTVLDVKTLAERAVPGEDRSVDDQIEWLDGSHLLYAVPREGSAIVDTWVAAIDGSVAPRIFVPEAESPAVVR